MKLKTAEIFGYLGIGILILVFVYLVFKIAGIVHSPAIEEVLLATVVGQLFYSGYTHRAIKDIDKRIERIEKRLKI